jgi:hypothetical protein
MIGLAGLRTREYPGFPSGERIFGGESLGLAGRQLSPVVRKRILWTFAVDHDPGCAFTGR